MAPGPSWGVFSGFLRLVFDFEVSAGIMAYFKPSGEETTQHRGARLSLVRNRCLSAYPGS